MLGVVNARRSDRSQAIVAAAAIVPTRPVVVAVTVVVVVVGVVVGDRRCALRGPRVVTPPYHLLAVLPYCAYRGMLLARMRCALLCDVGARGGRVLVQGISWEGAGTFCCFLVGMWRCWMEWLWSWISRKIQVKLCVIVFKLFVVYVVRSFLSMRFMEYM
jgi:hypothetical protein